MECKKISLSFAGVIFVWASLASGFPAHRGWSEWTDWTDYVQTFRNELPPALDSLLFSASSGVGPTEPQIYDAGPSSSSLVSHPGQNLFSSDSSIPVSEVIQTTAKAPEESPFSSVSPVPMFEVPARLIEVIQTPAEVENHSGLGSAGGNGNITYENVLYIIRKRLIHVDSSGDHARVSTA